MVQINLNKFIFGRDLVLICPYAKCSMSLDLMGIQLPGVVCQTDWPVLIESRQILLCYSIAAFERFLYHFLHRSNRAIIVTTFRAPYGWKT